MLSGGHFIVAADHPALPGHFPGSPIVPGVVLLDLTLALLARHMSGLRVNAVRQVKFLAPVLPGQDIAVYFRQDAGRGVSFRCDRGGETILSGSLPPAADIGEGGT